MKQFGFSALRAVSSFSLLALFSLSMMFGQENTGSILGTVTDATGAVVPGATITASSARNPRGVTATSDNGGNYSLLYVPIGTYTVAVAKDGFTTLKQQNVEVTTGSQVTFSPKLSVSGATQTVEVVEAGTSLDTTSSRVDTTITQKQFENLAKGRTFNSILALAPGVRQEVKTTTAGVGGISVDGATGAENTYYIDGVEVSDVITGALRAQNAIPLDFIQEVNVRTGGFEAEYGGATGGVITVNLRSGANAFHGLAFMEGTGSPLNAGDRGYWQRSPLSASVADFFRPKEDDYRILYPGGDLSGRIIKDKLFFFAGYSPELEHTARVNNYTSGARSYNQDRLRQYAAGRLDYSATSKLQLYSSYVWSPSRRTGTLQNRDIRVAPPTNDLSIQGGYTPMQSYTGGATYSVTPRLILSARYGYRYLNDKDGNYGLSTAPYVVYNTAGSQSFLPIPSDVNFGNGYANVTTTLGTQRDITTRHNVYVDGTYITSIKGQQHTFKMGYSLNRNGQNILRDYTNGYFRIFWGDQFSRASITNATGQYGYYIWEDGVKLDSNVNGRNMGVYFQDTWRIHPRVTINAGFRMENEYLPPYRATYQGVAVDRPITFGWGDKIVPRLGGAWDIRGDGRWKLAASFGYFTDIIKYGLAQGSFGGQQWISHVYTLDNPAVFSLGKGNPGALGREITSYDNRTIDVQNGKWNGVDPDIKPYRARDITVSLDHQLATRLVASLRYTRKDLLRGVEDIGVLDAEGNEVYIVGNPGYGATRDTKTVYGQKTPNGQEFLVPRATRQYDAVEFRLNGQIGRFTLIPSYTWSRLWGNYSGLTNSDEAGRVDVNNNRAYDLPYYYFDASGSQKNTYGLLGTDRPHTFKFFGSYDLRTKIGTTTIGVNQLAYSGTPDTTTVLYLSAPTTPYGRGDLGRTPAYTQTDLYLAHEVRVTEGTRLKFTADVRNLFNQAAVIARVTQLNRTGNITIPQSQFFSGYDPKNPTYGVGSASIPYNAIYGLAGASNVNGGAFAAAGGISSAFSATFPNFGGYQDFRVIRLGARFIF